MNRYIIRLKSCGMSSDRAIRIYYSFLRKYGITELEEYICSLERDIYVDRVQSEPVS